MHDRMQDQSQLAGPPFGAEENGKKTQQYVYIKELASRKIRGFRGTIDEHGQYLDEVYQSNSSLTANIASDYRDRFLSELIQNAYDAHPVGTRDGRLEIILDMRICEHGTLFVACCRFAIAQLWVVVPKP